MSDTDLLSELDLTPDTPADPRTLGNVKRPLYIDFGRELTAGDIAALELPRGVKAPPLVRIHASHHSLARCIASGMKQSQASLVTGYNQSRISILMHDETFRALVEEYRAEAKSAFADIAERMSNVSLDAIEILHDRLQANPETFTIPVLLDVIKGFADRTGHGPGSEVSVKLDRDFIDRPPRETFAEWKARRDAELADEAAAVIREANEVKSGQGEVIPLRLIEGPPDGT